MRKKCLVAVLSALVLASGVSMSAHAQMREVIVVTDEEVQYVDETAQEQETMEELYVLGQDIDVPEQEMYESDGIGDDGAMPEELYSEPEVLENAEVISMEEYLEILGEEGAAEEKVIEYDFTVSEPDGTVVNLDLRVRGYANYDEYYASDKRNYYIRVSTRENFEDYISLSRTTGSINEEDAYVRYTKAEFYGAENTTYYAKAQVYDSALQVYVDVGEVRTFTTKEATPIDASMEFITSGAWYAAFEVKAKGINSNLLYNTVFVEYSKQNNFSSSSRNSMYFYDRDKDGYYEAVGKANYLNTETTYYCRLIKRVYGAEGYVNIPLSDKVIEITTEANEVYEDSRIPDETLRNLIKSWTRDVLDKVSLEQITNLTSNRQDASAAVIKDLTGIELLPALSYIELGYHDITDITPITQLPLLETAGFTGNNITAIPDLSGLEYLYNLYLRNNLIPKTEFVETNPYIPQKVLIYNSDWCTNAASTQRSSLEPEYIIADEYYNAGNGVFPIQIQLNNCRYQDVYTVSIYEGETAIAEDLQYSKRDTSYNWQMFVAEDCADELGSKELTFIVKVNGTALPGVTKTIRFTDKLLNGSGTTFYKEPENDYVSFSGYVYGVNSKATKIEMLDAKGNVVWSDNSISSTYDEAATDYRYEDLFGTALTKTTRAYFGASGYLDKLLPVGDYDLRFTLEDGTVCVAEDAYHITKHAVISSVDSWPSSYTNSMYSEYSYIKINGLNMDWTQLWPEVRDATGRVVSEVLEYKQTGRNSAIYKLRRLSGEYWNSNWELVIAQAKDYIILNNGEEYSLNVSSSADIYYAEHMLDSGKVRLVCENMEDGVPYEWTIEDYNDSTKTVLATCTAALTNGMAELAFKTADGSAFVFDTSKNIYTYRVRCITEGVAVSESVSNKNYGMDEYVGTNYDEIDSDVAPHINDGRSFTETKKLNYNLLTEDTVLTAVLYDEYGGLVTDKGMVTKEVVYEKYAGVGTKLWVLTISFDGVGWENSENYTYEITDGEKSYGESYIRMLDPGKPYYAIEGESYNAETGMLEVFPTGYFPSVIDRNRIGITVRDRDYNVVYRTTVINVAGSGANAGTLKEKIYLTFDLSQVAEGIAEQGGFYYQLTYDGDKIWDAYYAYNLHSAYIGSDEDSYIRYTYSNNRYMIKGVYKEGGNALTACFYDPYDTTLLWKTEIPVDVEGSYLFTAQDLLPLSFNGFDKVYSVVLLDSNGKYLDMLTGYLQVSWPFLDVEESMSNWKYIGINYVYNMDIMNGTSAITFNPDGKLTREMQIQILYNLENAPGVTYQGIFTDVPEGQWYSNAICWAAENGITAGMGDGTFGVGNNITREQLTVMLFSYAKQKGYDVSMEATVDGFADSAKISTWAKDALEWAVEANIISGKPGNLLDPQGQATRAECATMMRKFCIKYVE